MPGITYIIHHNKSTMSINNMKPEATITITTKRTPAYCYVIMAGAAVLFVGRAFMAGFFYSMLIDICS